MTKQFPSLEEAEAYMKERGELIYWGREGTDAKTYVYTLTVGMIVYHILLEDNGNLTVTDQMYKRGDEQ